MIKRNNLVFALLVLMLSLNLLGCEKEDKVSSLNNQKVENIKLSKGDKDDFVNMGLYFYEKSSSKKSEVAKEPRIINKEEVLAEFVMDELIKGPSPESKLSPILPKETKVLYVSVKDKVAYVNLSLEARSIDSKDQELACIKGIVYSLTNLGYVDKVKILINSKNADTLAGNYSISKPLGRDDVKLLK
ncbi:GerMN domain-containing protein [Haloimpatiens sp. FM7315]|uniref:GerMN domain-containing protein n=1 Tax=Haloimpatiens sp. FM7315 TaxID=3298609 RepID=UPI0035A2E941